MSNFYIDLTNVSEDEIERYLRAQMAMRSRNPLRTWRWWSGFIAGAIVIASMDLGDIHVCAGQCDGVGGYIRVGSK